MRKSSRLQLPIESLPSFGSRDVGKQSIPLSALLGSQSTERRRTAASRSTTSFRAAASRRSGGRQTLVGTADTAHSSRTDPTCSCRRRTTPDSVVRTYVHTAGSSAGGVAPCRCCIRSFRRLPGLETTPLFAELFGLYRLFRPKTRALAEVSYCMNARCDLKTCMTWRLQ